MRALALRRHRLARGLALLVAWAAVCAPGLAQTQAVSRADRHALVIGIGEYRQDPARPVPALEGVKHDMVSARAMAALLEVPAQQITELRDSQATRANIIAAIGRKGPT